MSKDSNKNNLEDFFRNSLKDYSENPSIDLWDRIEGNIPPKPSRKISPAYVLLALLLLILAGLGYEYFQFRNQMIAVNETVNVQKQELNQLKNELESVKDQLQTATQSSANEATADEKATASTTVSNFSKIPDSKIPANPKTEVAAIPFPTLVHENKNAIDLFEEEDSDENQILAQADAEQKNVNFALEPTISLDYLAAKPSVAESFAESKLPSAVLPKRSGKPVFIEVYASALKTFPNTSHNSDKAKVNNFQLSSDFGALFNYGLSENWDIQLGVGYSRMVINDAVSADLIYSRDELDQSRGTYTSFYSYTVNTPAGEIAVNSSLSNQKINDGRDLEEGDPFQLDLEYQDVIQYFQLPVFVRYKMGTGKYRFTVKGGVIQKFLLEENIQLSAVNPEFDRLQNDMSHISNNKTSASATSMDALFGAGIEYKLSRRNSLHLQSTFSYSLQEIYPGSKPISAGLNLGLQHRLGR